MKRLVAFFILLTLEVASFIFFTNDRTDPSNQPDQSDLSPRPAHVPDPGETVPIATIRPEDLGITVPTTPFDPQALIAKALSDNNLAAIQSAALTWFQQDPTAARDWLASQTTFEDLQPAISFIAAHISENGDIRTAIEWVNILADPNARENALFDIQALALRNQRITPKEISTEGLSPERVDELLSGAAGD